MTKKFGAVCNKLSISEKLKQQVTAPPLKLIATRPALVARPPMPPTAPPATPPTAPSAVARLRSAVEQRVYTVVDILNYRKDGTSFWNVAPRPTHYAADSNAL